MAATAPIARPRLSAQASRAEQFALWAIRLWWSRYPQLDAVWPKLEHGFRIFGMPAALEPLHGFCSIALVMSEDPPSVACSRCSSINSHEERLLRILCLAAQGEGPLANQQLLSALPATSARLATRHAERFAQMLIVAGLIWPRCDEPRGERFSSIFDSHSNTSLRLH